MPSMRWIPTPSGPMRLSALANRYGLAPSTLSHRLDRFGETSTGLARALATGLMSREQSGRMGAARSPWRSGYR